MRRAGTALAALTLVLVAACAGPDEPGGEASSNTAGASSNTAGASSDGGSDAGELAQASLDAVEAVGRGAVIAAERDGDAWDMTVSSHAGQTWIVAGVPDDGATVQDVDVDDETATLHGRVRTVLDTAPTLDERADDVVAAVDGEPVTSVVLTERGDETVWAVTGADGTTSDLSAAP